MAIYKCIIDFTSSQRKVYRYGDRISHVDYNQLTSTEKNKFYRDDESSTSFYSGTKDYGGSDYDIGWSSSDSKNDSSKSVNFGGGNF